MRVPFERVFSTNADGSIAPKVPVRVGGVARAPGSEFGARVRLGSVVDFAALRGRDLEVDIDGQGYVLVHPHRSRRIVPPK
ncbi:MAG TPA: hypothetical protein VHI93_01175 [Candidatus Thermoplasmatota archaeon]|nr:hypothetical protein [Candidatus Thermoplasmatota archaeon]